MYIKIRQHSSSGISCYQLLQIIRILGQICIKDKTLKLLSVGRLVLPLQSGQRRCAMITNPNSLIPQTDVVDL